MLTRRLLLATMGWSMTVFQAWTSISVLFPIIWAMGPVPCTDPLAFACGDGSCISREYYCNGFQDCPNLVDERNCDFACGGFQCKYSQQCIDYYGVCTGTVECLGASDELGCGPLYLCQADQFFCASDNTCRDYTELCDGVHDCYAFDESFCDRFCDEREYTLRPNEVVYFEQSPVNAPPSGFYHCSWNIVADVYAYMFIEVEHWRIPPTTGKFRLSAGIGSDPTTTETVIFSTDLSAVAEGNVYVANRTTRAWVLIRSSYFQANSFYDPQVVVLKIYQRSERICPVGLVSCGDQIDATVCIPESALCDTKFDCPDFWDESRCPLGHEAICGAQQLHSMSSAERRVFQIQEAQHFVSLDCLWFVDIPLESRVEIIIQNFPERDSLLIFGTTNKNLTVDLSATFHVASSERWVTPPVYSPEGGPVWIAARLNFPGSVLFEIEQELEFTLRTFEEIECGPDTFACDGSELCLPLTQRCDGIPQCPSLTDERGCSQCEPDVLTCDVHTCVEEKLVCDGLAQCQDMTDEYPCGHCGATPDLSNGEVHEISWLVGGSHPGDCLFYLTSSPGNRISIRLRRLPRANIIYPKAKLSMGNGHNISDQSTSLLNILFTEDISYNYREVVTSSGPLMWIMYKFEAYPNDQLDAFGFQSIHLEITQLRQDACAEEDHACALGECINRRQVCDGYVDCFDYSDEIGCGNCTSDEFRCVSVDVCIHETSLCGPEITCPDASDHHVCGPCGRAFFDLSHGEAIGIESYTLQSPTNLQPPHPLFVSPDTQCTWRVDAPASHRALAKIESFQTSPDYDKVTLGWGSDPNDLNSRFGPVLAGRDIGLTLVASRDNQLWITFVSRAVTSESKGFIFRIESRRKVTCEKNETRCGAPDVLCVHQTASEYQMSYLCSQDICGQRIIHLMEGLQYNLTSPNYPNKYPNGLNCVWEFKAPREFAAIVVSILDFETETRYDRVRIDSPGLILTDTPEGDMVSLTGTTRITTVTSLIPRVNITMISDTSIMKKGFLMTIQAFKDVTESECSGELDLLCENTTYCIEPDAVCNGFNDCDFGFDEFQCFTIDCSEFFQCSRSRECMVWDKVCDGTEDCLLGDDEIRCDLTRCPGNCTCYYKDDALHVSCQFGWTRDTLENMAATTDVLELSAGPTDVLEQGLFKRFIRLRVLYLTGNNIQRIPALAFDGLQNLLWLNISVNNLTTLESDAFQGLNNLHGIVISENPLLSIEESAFKGLAELKTLVLIRGRYAQEQDEPISIHPSVVRDLTNLHTLYLDDYRLCCEFRKHKSFDIDNCFTTEQQSPLFNCGSLMQNTFLRVFMWFLGFSALLGNFGVVCWRSWISMSKNLGHGTKYVNNFLILNLAVSDFLMGIYMVIIAAADVFYGEAYYIVSLEWRLSAVCKIAGILSVLSSEASVFFITLISVDRFLCIVFPHGRFRLTKSSARLAVLFIWAGAFIISCLPTILIGSDTNSDIYGLSDVCIGLPLITKPASYVLKEDDIGNPLGTQSFKIPVPQDHRPAWVYSIVLFLGVNLLCFVTIALCYVIIFIQFRVSNQRVKGSKSRGSTVHRVDREEMNVALRMAVIVGTDFCCWMPVIIMGLLSQSGAVTILPHMYAWTVVFILPINSSLNPYLYTVSSVVSAPCSKHRSNSSNTTSALRTKSKDKSNEAHVVVVCKCADSCPENETHL